MDAKTVAISTDTEFFPMPDFCRIEQTEVLADCISITLCSDQPTSCCPGCAQPSGRIQSHYTRHLGDLPCSGLAVRLHFKVRRFYCANDTCSQRIFTERFGDWLEPYARRTERLQSTVWQIGYAVGGEGGARLAKKLSIPISADTVLRQLHRTPLADVKTPRVLGIDDWSYRRGQHYGTILVDLETHEPIDLLPDREADTLADWLQAHEGIEIITRDRSGIYADGARRGAPKALQVADRWHLLKNLREAIERVIAHHYDQVKQVAKSHPPTPARAVPKSPAVAPEKKAPAKPVKPRASMATARLQRLEKYQQVHRLRQQGVSILQIAKRLRMARKTVRRYLNAKTFPERAARPRQKHHKIDPYLPYLQQRWQAGCQVVVRLWREILAQGFRGSLSAVYYVVRPWREAQGGHTDSKAPVRDKLPSARQISWWLLNLIQPKKKKKPAPVDETDKPAAQARQDFIAELCRQRPPIEQAQQLGNAFIEMVRQRSGDEPLEPWIDQVQHSDVTELKGFVSGLINDKAAVIAAMTLPWSNGQVEGQVNRLKSIKRQMYGRASFELSI